MVVRLDGPVLADEAGQSAQVRPDRVEGVEGDHGVGQVHRFQQLGEVAGLVVFDALYRSKNVATGLTCGFR